MLTEMIAGIILVGRYTLQCGRFHRIGLKHRYSFEHEGEGGPNLLFEPCHELLCLVGQLAS